MKESIVCGHTIIISNATAATYLWQLNLLSVIERYFCDFHPPPAILHIAPPWMFHVQFWLEFCDQVVALVQLGNMTGKPRNYRENSSYNLCISIRIVIVLHMSLHLGLMVLQDKIFTKESASLHRRIVLRKLMRFPCPISTLVIVARCPP